ncbi:MAG: hypothetical protein HY234_11545 [Acidobacteria bacterium]|nr:hypothetical protein [Acidobacteriota bacterium]MBI3663667.1 hypothetical protein [Acidobacteriota bacterium]
MLRKSLGILSAIALMATASVAQKPKSKPKEAPVPAAAAAAPAAPAELALDPVLLRNLKARSIGPAVMGGRVSDIAIDPNDPSTFYVALGTGGVMKTTNNGVTLDGIFEKEAVAAVGAVAVAPSDSKVVWVGTGEANDRNSSSWGGGVYRSTDGGDTWTNTGLKNSRTIARIVVHPSDPKTAWVAAVGDLWNFGGDRGLYKTTDGGATWKRVLGAPAPYNDRVGCGDVALDPSDSNVLYATLYARQRTPWSFLSGRAITDGKDVGGIFKSTDSGETWKKLDKGLPGGMGRIGLSIYRKNPKIVYAVVQSDEGGTSAIDEIRSKRGGVFRSEDAGESWTRMNGLNPRPFYFSQIRVDPENDQRIYVLGFALHVSDDGGKSFREDLFEKVHPDLHALAIDARNPKRVLLGTDGGLYQSFDAGKVWEHLTRFAAGEFYRINYDMSTPYRICGGLQDNLNWVGPSRTRTKDGIVNSDWINIGGGDGFYCVFDPDDPEIVYTESQQGFVHRMNMRNGQVKMLRPEPSEGQKAFRFHWNSPLIASRHARGTMYLGGNHVFRLTAQGEQWQMISPDLSTQDPGKTVAVGSGAENYAVAYTLAESPVKAGLLWAATDDGKLWLTESDGQNWTDLTANLPAPAKGQWIMRIEASSHDANVAYLAVDAHRTGNFAPLAYRTADGGKTWQSIAANLPAEGPVKVIREDPKNPRLLYAGTEFGLFVSVDRGANWIKFGDLPTVAVDDIAVHPRENDLILATHGRSLFIVDDIRPLQQLTPEVREKPAHLFPLRPLLGMHMMPGFVDWDGKAVFRGDNAPEGALINFFLKAYTGEEVKIKVTDAAGTPVAKFKLAGTPGINRITWDLKPTKDVLTEYGGEGQKHVKPGEYAVTLVYGNYSQTEKIQVTIAPGVETR